MALLQSKVKKQQAAVRLYTQHRRRRLLLLLLAVATVLWLVLLEPAKSSRSSRWVQNLSTWHLSA
jgi:hypothetical protein